MCLSPFRVGIQKNMYCLNCIRLLKLWKAQKYITEEFQNLYFSVVYFCSGQNYYNADISVLHEGPQCALRPALISSRHRSLRMTQLPWMNL